MCVQWVHYLKLQYVRIRYNFVFTIRYLTDIVDRGLQSSGSVSDLMFRLRWRCVPWRWFHIFTWNPIMQTLVRNTLKVRVHWVQTSDPWLWRRTRALLTLMPRRSEDNIDAVNNIPLWYISMESFLYSSFK